MLRLLLQPLTLVNNIALKCCNVIGVLAIAAMVIAILVQVYFRYVQGNALPWPDEFARFCMLWMTGLMAPIAYRQGGFVAIDMLNDMLGKRASAALFSSSSLKIPLSLIGMQSIKLKLVYMYSSLWIGLILLTSVNIELVLRSLNTLISGNDEAGPPAASPVDRVGAS